MQLTFKSSGSTTTLNFQPMTSLAAGAGPAPAKAGFKALAASGKKSGAAGKKEAAKSLYTALSAVKSRLPHLYSAWNETINETEPLYMLTKSGDTLIIATDCITVEAAKVAALKMLREKYGFEVVREGKENKLLLRTGETGEKALKQVQAALKSLTAQGGAKAAHPHFVRTFFRPNPSAAGGQPLWNHLNSGGPGVPGADVAAQAAWTITRGKSDIRVAVLDEGVDSKHPALKPAIVAERDFVDQNPHARPDGDDAHGTACAGIIASRDKKMPGLAPECSLVGVRIAKGDGNDGWVFDDFNTADAIDWSWNEAKASVLSNSWGGGPAVDVITNAITRATKQGRGGKGSVVVFAAGNSDGAIDFPGSLSSVLTVGASTPWDERKSPTSKDGENWWGSCFGEALDLLAPGVKIATSDISGTRGYSSTNFTKGFNGTSSATPHVAAAAALVLSVAPALKESDVRRILTASCDRLTANGAWHKEFGHGRLNIYTALRLAAR
jgi:thermitase